jgi:hypothetical protein
MAYIGKPPTPAALTSDDLSDNIVVTGKIADGTITNADITTANADRIAHTKITPPQYASLSALNSSYAASADNHGALAHAHAEGKVYFSHNDGSGSAWHPLANEDAELLAIGALTPTDGNVIVGSGTGSSITWVAESGGTLRTSLGVDEAGTDNSTDVTLASVTDNYLSLSGQAITAGIVPLALGGTGSATASLARSALGLGTSATAAATAYATSTQGTKADNAAALANDQTFTGANRGAITVDNDGSFDLAVTNNFKCTPTANITSSGFTFTNVSAATGQSGNIIFVNGSNYTVSINTSVVKIKSGDATTISATGTYWLSYICDGTLVYVVVSGKLE